MDLREYLRLKKGLERINRQIIHEEESLKLHMEELKTEHKCDSVEKAKYQLVKIDREIQKANREYEKSSKAFEAKYFEYLP